MKHIFLFIVLLLLLRPGYSQINDSSIVIPAIRAGFGLQFPAGDMAKRFGVNGTIGPGFMLKFKNNITLEIDGSFIFGNRVNEDNILDSLKTDNGNLINRNGEYSDYILEERGFYITANAGYLWNVIGPNPNSGLRFNFGVGFLQHRIYINENGKYTASINDDYSKGYDRLSNGLCLKQSIGYLHFGKNKLLNYQISFEMHEAFTQNRRSINFDTQMQDTSERLDILYTIRLSWLLPLYTRMPDKYYYY